MERIYAAIDLKSFYASVECVERGLDPSRTALVVADRTRTDKTICLAVSPGLKEFGIPGRPRLFEVKQAVKRLNRIRRSKQPGGCIGCSVDCSLLRADGRFEIGFIAAVPRMALYLEYSRRIYEIYLHYFSEEDIHVYSIDEVFVDLTAYMRTYRKKAKTLVSEVVAAIMEETGITAAAGIGTNLYLSKVAMDIMAKKAPPDKNGVRIAFLDETKYRKQMWDHRPITDFWRVGRGYARRLEENGMFTMGDVARCSLGKVQDYHNGDLLYSLFGINAELLIDHAWGTETCTMADIKAYRPASKSISSGQVFCEPYTWEGARIVVREMTEALVLELIEKKMETGVVGLYIRYDVGNMKETVSGVSYEGEYKTDFYGRKMPRGAHGTEIMAWPSSSLRDITAAMMRLYDRISDKDLYIRKMAVEFGRVCREDERTSCGDGAGQMSLFDIGLEDEYEYEDEAEQPGKEGRRDRERHLQEALVEIRRRYGKNAVFKAMSLQEGATARERNRQIGGHKA